MVKLGIVVFANNSGLGNQTKRLTEMLNPFRILAVDSTSFSKNKEQHFEWYNAYSGYKVDGFPSNREVQVFLQGLTHVLVCENPLNYTMLRRAETMNIKLFIQSNYEFCDHLDKQLHLPYKFLMPSYWHVDTMKQKFGEDRVMYLPPPTHPHEFKNAREENLERTDYKKKFLHIVGTLAAEDRNGTLDLIKAVEASTSNYEITIRSQRELPEDYKSLDKRIKYVFDDLADPQDLYKGFDALFLPRRYGGLSLTTNEALMSALPVFMTNVSPNKQLLPKEWLYKANKKSELFTRTYIDVYESDIVELANKLDEIANLPLDRMKALKLEALDLGINNFSSDVLREQYEALFV